MRRRKFITLLGGAAVAWPLVARAQRVAVRVGYLGGASTAAEALNDCFRSGLRDAGWIEGKNITIKYQWTEGVLEQISSGAVELVRERPDLIVAVSTPGAQAIQRATRDIPVVFIGVSDPVASGIVASLARPGGNITGVSNFLPATSSKLLELLKSIAPHTSQVGILYNPDNPGKVLETRELQAATQTFGIGIELLQVRSSDDFEPAFKKAIEVHCDAILPLHEGVALTNRSRIIAFALENRLPAIYQLREWVESGGLISYGLNYCEHYRRGAYYVDKILKGAKPADLPVELPTKFELAVNLKTAKVLGLTIPDKLLSTADAVIE
jgi:putative ABC transport system substrate-binding protein